MGCFDQYYKYTINNTLLIRKYMLRINRFITTTQTPEATYIPMSIMKPVPQRRCINYKKVEAPVYYKMETKLCEELGITYSELHKQSVRRLFNSRLNAQQLELVY